jgi:hypothetical protein
MSHRRLWPVRLYYIFPHYLKNGKIFEKMLSNITRASIFSTALYESLFTLRTERDKIKHLYWSSCKVPFILNTWLNRKFLDSTQISNFMKIRPVGAELFHADRQTDMMMLIVAFRNFANAPTIPVISKLVFKFKATWSLSFTQCSIVPWNACKLRWISFSTFLSSMRLWATFRIFFSSKSFVVDKKLIKD